MAGDGKFCCGIVTLVAVGSYLLTAFAISVWGLVIGSRHLDQGEIAIWLIVAASVGIVSAVFHCSCGTSSRDKEAHRTACDRTADCIGQLFTLFSLGWFVYGVLLLSNLPSAINPELAHTFKVYMWFAIASYSAIFVVCFGALCCICMATEEREFTFPSLPRPQPRPRPVPRPRSAITSPPTPPSSSTPVMAILVNNNDDATIPVAVINTEGGKEVMDKV